MAVSICNLDPRSGSRVGQRSSLPCPSLRNGFAAWAAILGLLGIAIARVHAESPVERSNGIEKTEMKSVAPTDAPPSEPEFVLILGQITNSIGAGLDQVSVSVYRVAADGSRGELIATATTDSMGDFEVRADPPVDGAAWVTFNKPSFAEFAQQIELVSGDPPYLAESLKGALALVGRIENATDRSPIANAAIELSAMYQQWKATSDDKGGFRIDGVAPGRGELTVTADGFGRERRRIANMSDPSDTPGKNAGAPSELVITLKPERVVRIMVVDNDDRPIAGAVVELNDQPRGDYRTVITDELGKAIVEGLHFDATELAVRLRHDDFVSSGDTAPLNAASPPGTVRSNPALSGGIDRIIPLPVDEIDSSHTLIMQRAGKVQGLVTDTDGKPLYGARVISGTNCWADSPRGWTDFEGRFSMVGIPPGETVLTVHLSGFSPDLRVIDARPSDLGGGTVRLNPASPPDDARSNPAAPGGGNSVSFTLERAAVVRGKVTDSDGAPIRGAELEAIQWRGFETLCLRAMTDADGLFVMENSPADEFEVQVFAPGSLPKTAAVAANPTAPIRIQLERSPDRSERRALPIGEGVPDVTVTLLDGKPFDFTAQKGKVVVVDFWATWCAPCLAEMPRLIETHEKFRGRKDFVMLGISRDFSEPDLRSFLQKNPRVAWPQSVGDENGVDLAAVKFGVEGLPTMYVIDKDGRVAAAGIHAVDLPALLDRLFAMPNPSGDPEANNSTLGRVEPVEAP